MRNTIRLNATVFAALLSWWTVAPAAAEEFAVPLSVQESAGVARTAEPISGGVPLPKGQFKVGQPFGLFTVDGREIPCQVQPLVVETDGTLRWVLLDFQDNIPAGATNGYVLRAVKPGEVGRGSRGLKIADDPQSVTLDTGRIALRVSKRRPFGLFEQVTAGGKPVVAGGEVSYVQMQGRKGWNDKSPWQPKKLLAGVPESVKVHYAGPLRATVEVQGKFVGDPLGAGYRATITAWAGQSRVLVRYKLCNSNPEQYTTILVNRSTLDLKLASAADKTLLGAAKPLAAGRDAWLHQGLLLHHTYQDIAGAVKAGSGSETLWTGNGPQDRPQGWIAAVAPQRVFVADKLFASNPARRLSIGKDRLVLEGIAPRFDGPLDQKFEKQRRVGQPWQAEGFWLYDCSHHSSEYLFDFAAPADDALPAVAEAGRNRLWALPPAEYISQCDVLGTGRFGTLDDERTCYKQWGWTFKDAQLPQAAAAPGAFVAGEDNHGESEADSVQGLLLMYVRTGQRGWFDRGEAWARYHADLQAWRTDGWAWKDGAIWFPSGGPQGNRQVRKKWNFDWGPNWGQREKDPDCIDLWRHCQSKSCYCHFYGSGLADYFCLTGDRDALTAAVDNVQQKDDEFRHFRQFMPGKTEIGCIRGFGRGFEVMLRVLQADPGNRTIRDLCQLSARTLWQSPLLDERGFHLSKLGGGFGGMAAKELTPAIKKWMADRGITFTTAGDTVDTLSKDGRTWPVRCMGGTWQHVYIHNGADLYARYFDDEDMRDFAIAFGQTERPLYAEPEVSPDVVLHQLRRARLRHGLRPVGLRAHGDQGRRRLRPLGLVHAVLSRMPVPRRSA